MSQDQVDWLELGFAHPAIRALIPRAAPSIVLDLRPVRVVWASSEADTFFGTADLDEITRLLTGPDGAFAKAIGALARDLAPGSGPRLHRLRVDRGRGWGSVTLLCRRLSGPGGQDRLALAVVDSGAARWSGSQNATVRGRPAPRSAEPHDPPLTVMSRGVAPAGTPVEIERERLQTEFGGADSVGFRWRTDPSGRVLEFESAPFKRFRAAVCPDAQDPLVGTIAEFAPGEAAHLEQALASRKPWSRVTIMWPLAGQEVAVPVMLAGSPQFEAGRDFAGYRGFGIVDLAHLAPIVADEPETGPADLPEPASGGALPGPKLEPAETPPESAFGDTDRSNFDAEPIAERRPDQLAGARQDDGGDQRPVPPANVVQLRPSSGLVMADRELTQDRNGTLSSSEHFAFQEIARALAGRLLENEPGPGRPDAGRGSAQERDAPARAIADLDRPEQEPAATAPPEGGQDAAAPDPGVPGSQSSAVPWPALLDTAVDAIAALDGAGRVLTVNRQGERWFGRERSQLTGERFSALLGPENQGIAASLLPEIEGRPGLFAEASREFVMRMPEGTFRPMLLTLTRVGDGLFSALWRDLSGIKRLERELTRAELEAERVGRRQADFLAKASHEIRSPLNAILGFAEIMMEERFGPLGTRRYKDYLQDIHVSGKHVVTLIDDLLDLSRIEAGQVELRRDAVDLNKVIGDCVSQLQPQAHRERVIVRTSFGAHLPPVVADEHSVRQIVTSLLGNGVKFNEPGGQVIVSTALNDAGNVVARIRDTGLGMSDSDVSAALEPFRQLVPSKNATGTGLGLPLTKALAGANGATLSIRSRPGEGTLVEVSFAPAAATPARVPA